MSAIDEGLKSSLEKLKAMDTSNFTDEQKEQRQMSINGIEEILKLSMSNIDTVGDLIDYLTKNYTRDRKLRLQASPNDSLRYSIDSRCIKDENNWITITL